MKMIQVTAAVIEQQGRYLLARRKPGQSQGGLWELPGGKIKSGETPPECLARELQEELGITARIGSFFSKNIHKYPDYTIELLAYRAEPASTAFSLADHDEVRWVGQQDINVMNIAPADLPILEKLFANKLWEMGTEA